MWIPEVLDRTQAWFMYQQFLLKRLNKYQSMLGLEYYTEIYMHFLIFFFSFFFYVQFLWRETLKQKF